MITVEKPGEDRLNREGVFGWPVWEKEVSEFPWEYDMLEVCYILQGRAIITPESGPSVEIGPGDLVTFPAGMKCRWRITEPIRKHYDFR
ncbi:MAG TPA: cupin domain-containing protein [Candidatus Sabulitectum sp.]|nr:cupin domain-containing protein [Candidatus Sabulitectum sp.]HPR23435.1 cupin domain-containing protein [Candidatus Sabulitectum sp.]